MKRPSGDQCGENNPSEPEILWIRKSRIFIARSLPGACELPRLRSPMPKVRRPESLKQALWGWRNLREVRLRNGQMGPPDFVNR